MLVAERVDVAYALVPDVTGERVLLVCNRDTWSLPGGRREDGETLAEAAARETREEAGVDVAVGAVVHVSERLDAKLHDLFVVFHAELPEGQQPAAGHGDEDVTLASWVPVDKASELMPWYPDGVAAMLRVGGAGYSAVRE